MNSFILGTSRQQVRLGKELGTGGEGKVFSLDGSPNRVAKIYHRPPTQEKTHKLLQMVSKAKPSITEVAAWPVELLLSTNGVTVGFVMPRVIGRHDIHELYSPKSRTQHFPECDFRFLVHVSANLCRAFATIHSEGHVMGDVNHGNVLVAQDGTVYVIDCDSFQVNVANRVIPCDVGVPLFTAPELQSKPFRGLLRTQNHDVFGLAVLLFHLLFMGRHPFAGRYVGHGEMPIERAISEYRFAYAPDRDIHRMECPPGALSLEVLGPQIAYLFARSFGRDGTTSGRPDPRQWLVTLEQLQKSLRQCPKAPWHYFPNVTSSCPWCHLEAQTGARLFGMRISGGVDAYLRDKDVLWQRIVAIQHPGPDPELPSCRIWSPPTDLVIPSDILSSIRATASIAIICIGLGSCISIQDGAGIAASIIAWIIGLILWPRNRPIRAAADASLSAARSDWSAALAQWESQATSRRFSELFDKLRGLHSELSLLGSERQRRISELQRNKQATQLNAHLDTFRIDRYSVSGIGPTRISMLASYGIETAADIDRRKIRRIPGFGRVLTNSLCQWRTAIEGRFQFNPLQPVDNRLIANIDQEIRAKENASIVGLQLGYSELVRISHEITAARTRLLPILDRTWNAYKTAELIWSKL